MSTLIQLGHSTAELGYSVFIINVKRLSTIELGASVSGFVVALVVGCSESEKSKQLIVAVKALQAKIS